MAGTLNLPTLFQRVVLDTRGVQKGAATAETAMTRAGKASGRLGDEAAAAGRKFNLSSLAVVAGSALVVGSLTHAVQAAIAYGASIAKLSALTGDSVENTSRFAFAAGRLGISVDQIGRPLLILSKTIETNGDALKRFGVTEDDLRRFKTQPLTKTVLELNDAYHKLNKGTEQNAFLSVVAGRGALGLRRLFTTSREDLVALEAEADKFGLTLSEKTIVALRETADNERALGQATKSLQLQIGLALLPVVEKVTVGLTTLLVGFNSLPGPVKHVAIDVLALAAALLLLDKTLALIGVEGAAAALFGFGKAAVAGAVGSLRALAALNAMEAAGVSLSEMLGVSLVGTLGVLVGGLTAVGIVALGVGLGLRELHKHFVENRQAAHDLGIEAAKDATVLAKVAGKTGGQAAADKVFGAVIDEFKKLRKEGLLTDKTMTVVTDHFNLLIKAVQQGKNVGAVLDALAHGNVTLAASIVGASEAEARATENTAASKQAHEELAIAVTLAAAAAKVQGEAQDKLTSAIDAFGPTSKQAIEAETAYADTLLRSQGFLLDGTDDQKKLDEARGQAITRVQELAQAEVEANAKRIASNLKLIASFELIKQEGEPTTDERKKLLEDREKAVDGLADANDRLRDAEAKVVDARRHIGGGPERKKELDSALRDLEDAKRGVESAKRTIGDANEALQKGSKSALENFLDSTRKNTATINQFYDDIATIQKSGNIAVAAELAAMGPSAAKAAHEAVTQLGKPGGLGDAEKVGEAAMKAAKRKIDAELETWVKNFKGKGEAAIGGLNEGLRSRIVTIGPTVPTGGGTGQVTIDLPTSHAGGLIGLRRFHRGGEVPIMAEAGEFVIRRTAVRAIGTDVLERLNSFHEGGSVTNNYETTHESRGGDINIGQVRAHDYRDFMRQMGRRRRLSELVNQ